MMRFISWYATKLEQYPLFTKATTSGIISGGGDLACQFLMYRHGETQQQQQNEKLVKEEKMKNVVPKGFQPDWLRTGRFTFLGFALVAPILNVWYSFLTKSIPGSTFTKALQRTFIDQVCFAPLFVPTFITSLLLLENEKSLQEIKAILKKDLPGVIVTNWSLWAPAMIINFRFVPIQWQVLYSNNVAFVWNMYLSWKTQEQDKDV